MSVSTPTQPTGEIKTLTPSPFVATWTHATGLSTKAVAIRLVHPLTGAVLRPSLVYGTLIAKTVLSGSNISISWAESQFAALDWGTLYGVQIRGQSTNDVFSDWSTAGVFSTNTAPTIPSGLSPSGGAIFTARPVLRCSASDLGTNPVTPIVYAIIRRLSATGDVVSAVGPRTMSYVGNGNYQYQTTSTDLPAFAKYDFYAYSYDGHLYSGSSLTSGGAAASGAVRFEYVAAPAVTITNPATSAILTSDTIRVEWTVNTPQRTYNITFYEAGVRKLGSGTVTHSRNYHTFHSGPALNNGGSYTVNIVVGTTQGTATATNAFSIVYTAATSLTGFSATATALGYDAMPTSVVTRWNQSAETTNFRQYEIGRIPLSGPGGSVIGDRVVIATITDRTQTVWIDAEGKSGQWYRYDVIQVVAVGSDTTTSNPVTAEAGVTFDGVVLGAVTDPEGFHVDLRYGARRGDEGDWEFAGGADYFRALGGAKAQAIPDAESTWNPSGNYRLHGDSRATSDQRFRALRDLVERKGTICYRDGRGEVRYVFLDRVRKQNTAMLQSEVSLQFREVSRDIGGIV